MFKFVTVLGLWALLGVTPVWADHGAPAPQLAGVTFCLDAASVQLETQAVTLSPAIRQTIRQQVFNTLKMQLETRRIPYTSDCSASRNYMLLSLYVRFLDPRIYVGFPENSYTYVTSAQVGHFIRGAGAEAVLPERSYTASVSDIFQAATPGKLEQRLILLGEAETKALRQTWLEANTVSSKNYLLFAALGVSFVGLRVLAFALR